MTISMLKSIPKYPTIFFLICWVSLTLQMGIFTHQIIPQRSLAYSFFLGGADAALLILPFLLLPPKFRLWVWIPVLASTIFTISNSLHFRYFTDLIYIHDYIDPGAYNKFTFSSGLSAWGMPETLMLLAGLAPVAAGCILWKSLRLQPLSLPAKLAAATCTIIYIFLQQCNLAFVRHDKFEWDTLLAQYTSRYEHSRIHSFKYKAQNLYIVEQIINIYKSLHPKALTRAQQSEAEQYIDVRHRLLINLEPLADLPDSLLAPGVKRYGNTPVTHKNLILIVVESLSSHVITDRFGDLTPMPYLKSLAMSDSALFFPRTEKFTSIGRSNDGNMIYETGLIPLNYKNTLFAYPSAHYPSLAKALGRPAREYIADDPAFIYHHETNKSFGYNRLVSSWQPGIEPKEEDMNLVKTVLADIGNLPHPFYAKIVTIVMHHPYNSTYGFEPLPDSTAPYTGEGEVNYLQRCMATDKALKHLVESLKKERLYDESIIVFASDHEPTNAALEHNFTNDLAILILNSGYAGTIDGTARQIDLYTTLLDLFDLRSYFWAGTGQSLLRKNAHDPHTEDYSRSISALLIDSRYFDNIIDRSEHL